MGRIIASCPVLAILMQLLWCIMRFTSRTTGASSDFFFSVKSRAAMTGRHFGGESSCRKPQSPWNKCLTTLTRNKSYTSPLPWLSDLFSGLTRWKKEYRRILRSDFRSWYPPHFFLPRDALDGLIYWAKCTPELLHPKMWECKLMIMMS